MFFRLDPKELVKNRRRRVIYSKLILLNETLLISLCRYVEVNQILQKGLEPFHEVFRIFCGMNYHKYPYLMEFTSEEEIYFYQDLGKMLKSTIEEFFQVQNMDEVANRLLVISQHPVLFKKLCQIIEGIGILEGDNKFYPEPSITLKKAATRGEFGSDKYAIFRITFKKFALLYAKEFPILEKYAYKFEDILDLSLDQFLALNDKEKICFYLRQIIIYPFLIQLIYQRLANINGQGEYLRKILEYFLPEGSFLKNYVVPCKQ